MALDCNAAFGKYLRELRRRRGLSLEGVATRASRLADPVGKGYLSRCENGHQRPSFGKTIALCRTYDVPPDVLVERLELDMDLARIGAPRTASREFDELSRDAEFHLERGEYWQAYALARDAALLAVETRPAGRPRADVRIRRLRAGLRVGTIALHLGKPRFALHEFRHVRGLNGSGPPLAFVVMDRIARAYLLLGRLEPARRCADAALAGAESAGDPEALGSAMTGRARVAERDCDPRLALALYRRAHRAEREAGRREACVFALIDIARMRADLGEPRPARKTLFAAERQASRLRMIGARALARFHLGRLDEREGRHERARARWRAVARAAREVQDRALRFRAERRLYRQALVQGQEATARALRRSLERLAVTGTAVVDPADRPTGTATASSRPP